MTLSRWERIVWSAIWMIVLVSNATTGDWSVVAAACAVLILISALRAQTRETENERQWRDWWEEAYRDLRDSVEDAGVGVVYEDRDPARLYDQERDTETSRRDAGEEKPTQGGTV